MSQGNPPRLFTIISGLNFLQDPRGHSCSMEWVLISHHCNKGNDGDNIDSGRASIKKNDDSNENSAERVALVTGHLPNGDDSEDAGTGGEGGADSGVEEIRIELEVMAVITGDWGVGLN